MDKGYLGTTLGVEDDLKNGSMHTEISSSLSGKHEYVIDTETGKRSRTQTFFNLYDDQKSSWKNR